MADRKARQKFMATSRLGGKIEHDPNMPALRREWLAARIVAAFGVLLLALVVAGIVEDLWFAQPAVAPAAAPAAAPNAEARRQEDIALCTAALASAQALGIVPGFAVRDGDETRTTNVQGRYICNAKTDAARYTIIFDLACRNLGQSNCIVPFQIVQQGGGVIFQRPN
jgi:hypothetical protein